MSAQIHAPTAWPPENNTETPLTGEGGGLGSRFRLGGFGELKSSCPSWDSSSRPSIS